MTQWSYKPKSQNLIRIKITKYWRCWNCCYFSTCLRIDSFDGFYETYSSKPVDPARRTSQGSGPVYQLTDPFPSHHIPLVLEIFNKLLINWYKEKINKLVKDLTGTDRIFNNHTEIKIKKKNLGFLLHSFFFFFFFLFKWKFLNSNQFYVYQTYTVINFMYRKSSFDLIHMLCALWPCEEGWSRLPSCFDAKKKNINTE